MRIQQVITPDSTSATANQPPSQLSLQYQNVGSIGNNGWELQVTVRQGRLAGAVSLATVDSRVRSLAAGYTGDLRPGDRVLGVPGAVRPAPPRVRVTRVWTRGVRGAHRREPAQLRAWRARLRNHRARAHHHHRCAALVLLEKAEMEAGLGSRWMPWLYER